MHQRKNNLQELLGDELASVLAANCCGTAGAVSSGAQMRCNPPETFGGAWGSSRSPKEGDSLPIFILLPSLWGTSPFPVLALLRSRSACSSFLRFQHGNKAPSEAFSEGFCAPCAAQRLPQVRQSRARTAGSAASVLLAEQRHVPSWAGLGWGGQQNPKCLELALGKHGSGEWLSVRGSVIGCGEPLRGAAGESRQRRSRK